MKGLNQKFLVQFCVWVPLFHFSPVKIQIESMNKGGPPSRIVLVIIPSMQEQMILFYLQERHNLKCWYTISWVNCTAMTNKFTFHPQTSQHGYLALMVQNNGNSPDLKLAVIYWAGTLELQTYLILFDGKINHSRFTSGNRNASSLNTVQNCGTFAGSRTSDFSFFRNLLTTHIWSKRWQLPIWNSNALIILKRKTLWFL